MKRLIPKFSHAQLEVIQTICDSNGTPRVDSGYALKATTNDGSIAERIWHDRSTGDVRVDQRSVDSDEWVRVIDLCYRTTEADKSIIATIENEELIWWNETHESILSSDTFSSDCIGGWAKGIKYEDDLGWLLFEEGSEEERRDKEAIRLWKAEKALPSEYYRLNHDAADRIIQHGIIQHGVDFINGQCDANDLDKAIQMVLLGEDRYC